MAATRSTPLHSHFSFSYMRRGGRASVAKTNENETPSDKAATAAADTPATTPAVTEPVNPYENSIKPITSVSTVEAFWTIYDYMKRPNDLTPTTDYHCFREGIKPTWEDVSTIQRRKKELVVLCKIYLLILFQPGNAKGGKWIIRLPKGLSSRYWEEIVLALLGGQ